MGSYNLIYRDSDLDETHLTVESDGMGEGAVCIMLERFKEDTDKDGQADDIVCVVLDKQDIKELIGYLQAFL